MSDINQPTQGRTCSGYKSDKRLPALFIGHGAPLYTLGNNRYAQAWQTLGEQLPRPQAILCISAHWQTAGIRITAMEKPRTIHDFGNFGEPLSSMQYPVSGSPELAQYICARFNRSGSAFNIEPDYNWGLDHGSWCVLRCMYPQADIPVLQLSLSLNLTPQQHYQLGQALTFLRNENVLIMGSGNIVHNLNELNPSESYGADWAIRFDERVRELIEQGNHDPLINYSTLGRDAQRSMPTNEHYLPLLYVLGLQQADDQLSFPVEGMSYGSTSMRSVRLEESGVH